ncbi:MAG: hypothetical protein CL840_17815 [Crocinitomicaceae bacterium]|nr:hypothetical protein [Crocinitomicaceae bacterium]
MIRKSIVLLSIALGIITLWSCGSEAGTEQQSVEDNQEAVVEEVQVETEDTEEADFIIPSALQIHTIFKSSGLKYIDGITNAPDNTSKYLSKFEKLLNFGVYSADMFYCVLNDQTQLSTQYLKSIRTLSDETGMSGIFNSAPILERFEANIGNKDSVISIMLEFQEKTDVLIAENNEEHTAMVIFTGAWLEGMYIGLDAARNSDNEMLRERLIEQMTILPNLIKGLDIQPNKNDQTKDLQAKIVALSDYFGSIEGLKGEDEYSYDVSVLETSHFQEFYKQVSAMRNEITKSKV